MDELSKISAIQIRQLKKWIPQQIHFLFIPIV